MQIDLLNIIDIAFLVLSLIIALEICIWAILELVEQALTKEFHPGFLVKLFFMVAELIIFRFLYKLIRADGISSVLVALIKIGLICSMKAILGIHQEERIYKKILIQIAVFIVAMLDVSSLVILLITIIGLKLIWKGTIIETTKNE